MRGLVQRRVVAGGHRPGGAVGGGVLLAAGAGLAGLALGPFLHRLVTRLCAAGTAPPAAAGRLPAAATPRGRASTRLASRGAAVLSVLAGLLFAATAVRFGADPVLPAYLYLVAVGLVLAVVDLRTVRLPDVLTLPSYPVAAVLLGGAALAGSGSGSFSRALLGGAASWLLYLGLRLVSPGGLGAGDVKLAGLLGLYGGWLGWGVWASGVLAASVYAGVGGTVLLLLGRVDRRSHLAVGPFLVAGAVTSALLGRQLVRAVLGG